MARPKMSPRITEWIIRELASGTWPPGTRLPPSRELANEFNVSVCTMVAGLRRAARYGLLRVEQRRPVVVLPGADDRARRLLRRRSARVSTRRLALLIPERYIPLEKGTYWHHVAHAIIREAEARDIRPSLVPCPEANQLAFARTLTGRRYGAAVVLAFDAVHLPSLNEMARRRFPVLLHNRCIPGLNLPAVIRDDHGAAWRLAEMLAQHGHRNLCLILHAAKEQFMGGHCRVRGWLDFLKESGLLHSCTHPVYFTPWLSATDVSPIIRNMLSHADRPTGLVLSVEAPHYFQEGAFADLRIPEDVSMAVFDAEYADRVPQTAERPRLTVARLNQQRAAECVIELAERLFAGEPNLPNIRVPVEIDVTDSIGPAPKP